MDFTLRHDPGLIGFGMQSSGVCAKAELPRNSPTQVATTRLAMGKYIVRSLARDEHTSDHTNSSVTGERSSSKRRSIHPAQKDDLTDLTIGRASCRERVCQYV